MLIKVNMNPVTQESTEHKDKPIDMLYFRSLNQWRQNQKQRYSYASKYKWQRHLKVKKKIKISDDVVLRIL